MKNNRLWVRIIGRIIYWDDFADYCEPYAVQWVRVPKPHFDSAYATKEMCDLKGTETISDNGNDTMNLHFSRIRAPWSHWDKPAQTK